MSAPELVPERFSDAEAQAKVGRRVRTLTAFYRVPRDTTGRVVDTYEMSENRYDVVIQWNLPEAPEPILDRFAKSTYEQFLAEE